MARSRYLDIDVKRSVIVEGPNGIIEDERFNRPAKDGDQYTAEGIYTISVHNRYTGESTVKTLFVGSNDLLREYIAHGFNMDRLKYSSTYPVPSQYSALIRSARRPQKVLPRILCKRHNSVE